MKLKTIYLKNFRCYKDEVSIEIDDLTTFIGKIQKDVPKLFGISYSDKNGLDGVMKGKTAKNYLSKVFQEGMNMKYLEEIDPNGEVKGWFDKITSMLH